MQRINPPHINDVRRVYPREPVPAMPDYWRRVAHHEAGHAVMCEHYGIKPLWARIDAAGGEMDFDRTGAAENERDPDGLVALAAASIHHAGLAAELLLNGIDPGRVLVLRTSAGDTERAAAVLHERFPHCSGAHWFAQRKALHVLSIRWERVTEIAAHLLEHGTWSPDRAAR